jgi:hypothetical protein
MRIVRDQDSGQIQKKPLLIGLGVLGLLVLVGLFVMLPPHALPAIIGKLIPAGKSTNARPKVEHIGVNSTPKGPLDFKGTGSQTTPQFSAGDNWDLDWSYDCSNTKVKGQFIVSIFDHSGRASAATPPVIQFGDSGSGVQHYHKSGAYFLSVRSGCTWHATTRPSASPSPSATP